jgi:hypothetical protein
MEILEIRKNFNKPVVIHMSDRYSNSKIKILSEILRAKVMEEFNFPISMIGVKTDDKRVSSGMNMYLEDKLDIVVREIHFSYMTKEYLIKTINDNHPAINKTALNNFFKDFAYKVTVDFKVY